MIKDYYNESTKAISEYLKTKEELEAAEKAIQTRQEKLIRDSQEYQKLQKIYGNLQKENLNTQNTVKALQGMLGIMTLLVVVLFIIILS